MDLRHALCYMTTECFYQHVKGARRFFTMCTSAPVFGPSRHYRAGRAYLVRPARTVVWSFRFSPGKYHKRATGDRDRGRSARTVRKRAFRRVPGSRRARVRLETRVGAL